MGFRCESREQRKDSSREVWSRLVRQVLWSCKKWAMGHRAVLYHLFIYIFLYINCGYANEEPRDLVLDGI